MFDFLWVIRTIQLLSAKFQVLTSSGFKDMGSQSRDIFRIIRYTRGRNMANRAVREKKMKGTEKFWGSFSCSNNCFLLPKVPYVAKEKQKIF